MKVVILGSPQSGQKELFSILTGMSLETIQEKPMETQIGICQVRDPRMSRLIEMYKPKKITYARIEYLLLPDFNLQGPAKNLIFTQLKNADELCWVTSFENAADDVTGFVSELVIADLMFVEKRLETIAKDQKKKFTEQKEQEAKLMERCRQKLEEDKTLRELEFSIDEQKILQNYQLFTLKPVIIAVNVPEDKISETNIAKGVEEKFSYPAVTLSATLEQEVSQLEEADRAAFMQEMKIEEPAIEKMTRMAFSGLGLMVFFTVGEDEVRSWPVRKGASAPEAGSVIHSDIQKGFVRAEMFKYDQLIAAGSEAKLKELGQISLKGKDYIVEDGDILSFRFNV
ncbi:MAG: DUF933 domain-containing protein [bacterium]|nr:DUF933 domain-containing protein [Candidatus Margulisiibacteriota bacterium]